MLVPFGVTTVTSTVVPAVPAGAVTVICVELLTVTPLAATVPNLTDVAPEKVVPVRTTEVPPPAGPGGGLRPAPPGAVGGRRAQLAAPRRRRDARGVPSAWPY